MRRRPGRSSGRAPARRHARTRVVTQAKLPGYFGPYGGRFVAETLVPALDELTSAMSTIMDAEPYRTELGALLRDYVGRPTPLTTASRLARALDPEERFIDKLILKREDLCHTGAHKINNALGQVLLARNMGKRRIIAETGAGQHGVATATAAALFGLACEVYMGEVDIERQAPNVARMRMLGARVLPVGTGSRTLKDAMNEALRDWVTNVRTTYYCVGSAAGPHPYPTLVARLQEVIGQETRAQYLEKQGALPDAVLACVGGGSNAIGMFRGFVDDGDVALYGVEAAGLGVETTQHAATLTLGRVGVLHGSKSYVLCDDNGQIQEAHSISAGLDYPGVGPEHSLLKDNGRASYLTATDEEALASVRRVAETEGILIALETAHAFSRVLDVAKREAEKRNRKVRIVVTLSGRGDKDLATILAAEKPHVTH
jgi:tryptophan synthase beta chain